MCQLLLLHVVQKSFFHNLIFLMYCDWNKEHKFQILLPMAYLIKSKKKKKEIPCI
jgi:hypothetical protein